MSYILDALKRAETERERGHVPGLHTQTHAAEQAASPSASQPLIWVGLGVAMLAFGATWWFWPQATVTNTPPAAPPTAQRDAVEIPRPPAMTRPVESPYQPPQQVNPDAVAPALADQTASDKPPARVRVMPASAPTKPVAASSATRTATPAAPPPASSEVGELPDELRRQLPALQVTGAVYSSNPAQRLLLVNGLVLPQGSSVAQDLVIDDIGPHSSVLRFRGQRFKVNH